MMVRKLKTGILVTMLASSVMSMSALAAPSVGNSISHVLTNVVSPRWSETSDVIIYITADGNKLCVEAMVDGNTGTEKISGTLYLEKFSGGKWKQVKSWRMSGKGSINTEKFYTGVPGTEYRARLSIKVGSESIKEISDSCEL